MNDISETEYLNMVICHSVAIESKDIFDQFKGTLTALVEETHATPQNEVDFKINFLQQHLIKLFTGNNLIMALKNPNNSQSLLEVISEGFRTSIHAKKKLLTDDI